MHCTLLAPDLLRKPDPDGLPNHDVHTPALARLLARARCTTFDAVSMEPWLCEAFGVARQHDWPVAPLTLMHDGVDPGNAYWLRCDPVHLRPQRNQLLLTNNSEVAPTMDEAQSLVATLNAHFAPDDLAFRAPCPTRWYLRIEHAPALTTQALPEIAGGNVERYLPAGNESLQWHRKLNEIQMVLHAHPVNQARETTGQPAINSVWLWGGGVTPVVDGGRFTDVWSDEALALSLAIRSGVRAHQLPENAMSLFDATSSDNRQQLAVLPQLRTAARHPSADLRRATLSALEKHWFAPLLSALNHRRLERLSIVVLDIKRCRRYDISSGNLWKFWRPIRTLRHYA